MNLLQETNILYYHWIQREIYSKKKKKDLTFEVSRKNKQSGQILDLKKIVQINRFYCHFNICMLGIYSKC